jgi:glycosyltransferase involved in cell wall biosynthesis
LRILILNHNLRERGTWHRAWAIGRELGRRGHRVTLWTVAPDHYYRSQRRFHRPEDGGILEVMTPSWAPLAGPDDGWGPLDVAWRLARVLTEPMDLCYAFAHPPNVWLPAWAARRLRRVPVLYDWCDWYEGGIFPKRAQARRLGLMPAGERALQRRVERWEIALERRMPRLADAGVTVISERLRDLALEAGRRADEVLLVPNGANLEGIVPMDPVECRRQLGLAEAFGGPEPVGPILGYVANYHPDQELLLESVARAVRQAPAMRLLVAGAPLDAALTRRLGLEGVVIHLGQWPAERIGLVLGAADALALPLEDNASNRARVPFKFTDYLAAGRPIVTSPVGDLAGWFAPGAPDPIGAAAAPEPDAYGAAIAQVLTAEPSTRAAMGRAARSLAEREFSWPRLTDRIEAFLKGRGVGSQSAGDSKEKTNIGAI